MATVIGMATPNSALQAARLSLQMSQDDLARAVRAAGERIGRPNSANKRLIQRWEAGTVTAPHPAYARALEAVTGLPLATLGFTVPQARVADDGHGGHDLEDSPTGIPAGGRATAPRTAPATNYAGIWLSRYEFFSSGRGESFTGAHFVVLIQHGNVLTGRSLPNASLNPESPLTLDLTVDGSVITGTWTEQTASDGYYRGARYHGVLQLLVEPTGRRMAGKWVGFGKEMDVNTGPWELVFQDASTTKTVIDSYSRPPET